MDFLNSSKSIVLARKRISKKMTNMGPNIPAAETFAVAVVVAPVAAVCCPLIGMWALFKWWESKKV